MKKKKENSYLTFFIACSSGNRFPLPEASSGFKNPPLPCSKLKPNGNTCPWYPLLTPPPRAEMWLEPSPELSCSIIGEPAAKPPSLAAKPDSAEPKLGIPRICSRKSSVEEASFGLFAMSLTRPSREWVVSTSYESTHMKKKIKCSRKTDFYQSFELHLA